MSRFRNTETNVVVTVADEKDERFASPMWESEAEPKASAKRSSTSK